MPEVCLILHNLRSAHNVGAIFRVADAVGIKKIFLVGFTPAPADRFGRVNKEIAKTALGAEKSVPWQSVPRLASLKLAGYKLVALEQSRRSIDYKQVKLTGPTAVVVGNEVKGLAKSVLDKCDVVAELPMRGQKESLNVAVAAGIFLYRLLG